MSGFRHIILVGAILIAGLGAAKLRAQTVLGDPKDAAKTFASNCSGCHKSPQGLAKSGQVAGFLRQHYTTGPDMSAAMAAYLVSAGSAPAGKKGAVTPGEGPAAAAKTKGKKQEQLTAAHPSTGEAAAAQAQKQTLRGKQRPAKSQEAEPVVHVTPAEQPAGRPADPPSAEERRQATATANPSPVTSQQSAAGTPPPAAPPLMVLDIPLPPMPDAPPPELSQSAFSSSPLP